MARILINNEWYDEVSAKALRESEFENYFLENAETLYPDYFTVPFKGLIIDSEYGKVKADLALIDKEYLSWWVIEVEMSRHSLNGHVLPQVQRLANGVYGEDVAIYFNKKCPELDMEKLLVLMKGRQPKVMVVLDIPKEKWGPKLENHDAILSVFQIFRSKKGNHVYRVNGDYPHKFETGKSKCQFTHLLNNFLKVDSPVILNVPDKEIINIKIDSATTNWKRIDIQDTVYLYPVSYNPLDINKKYILLQEPDQTYHIKEYK